ncbi:TetR/AcrR family transcriptional regulator C-terminal domain-containing protein [Actinomadura montaniterrae]|uniref:TetR family transcriptional regulator n=1 Tax=Actinomadura montaniterrae TaxID=1803903 RepID=A0A6L3VZY5_9ACTN|nr:TetR/AcrR family transcriptional regulator C-terminal domain-containing protein [Actinomadura montaniterrae]KAB2379237.1 TetR family transcriptional regulator [Actinomadura montaniterrae]
MSRRDEVLQAAIDLLDDVGLDGLTMRTLADRLGVRASALYRHYPSKQALLDAMVAHLVAVHLDAAQDEPFTAPGAPWQERLRGLARATRATMLAHRDGARLIATVADPGEQATAAFGDLITALTAAGAPTETAMHAVDTVLAYVNGFTIEEQARKAGSPQWPRTRRDLAFNAGLDLFVTGIQSSIPTT